ncbi:hypothetical protein O3M35_012872 [Rhynocoris fuscipes]|uniref:Cystatin domain-containing protein n=1 Tax=Rhynocoris fuscipes TaxID=488301 RepID=A0AAW1CFM6_9HEMI
MSTANQNLIGAPKAASLDDAEIKEHISKVLSMQNTDAELVRIVSAKKQVVAGTKYIIEFEAKRANSDEVTLYSTSYLIQPWISKDLQILEFKIHS